MKRKIAVLGATGSIGTSTFKVLSEFPHLFEVTLLAANQNIQALAEQVYKALHLDAYGRVDFIMENTEEILRRTIYLKGFYYSELFACRKEGK